MSRYPDAVTIEYYDSTQWVDISSYVVSEIKGNQGFEDALDRVAYLGLLELELDNRDGLFMPMGGDDIRGLPTLTGFNKGSKIRVRVTVGRHNKVVWIGRIDSLEADDIITEEQRVRVLAVDWFDIAARFPMKGSDILLNKNLNEAFTALLERMSIQPEDTDFDEGTYTFPAVFEDVKDKTKAISEINKLTLSELGYTYLLMDGTLRVEDSTQRKGTRELDVIPGYPDVNLLLTDGDDFLLTDGDTLLLEEAEEAQLSTSIEKLDITLKNTVINRGDVRAYPVRTATSLEVVFKLGSPITVPAGQIITFIAHYVNQTTGENIQATNQQTPVSTTDYLMNSASDGSGSNLTANLTVTATYYGDIVEYSLHNTGSTDGWITLLQARGYGIYYNTPITATYEDEDSIETYGENIVEIEQKYKRNLWDALAYAKSGVERFKYPRLRVTSARFNANLNGSHLMAFLYLDVGSLIAINEAKSQITKHYYILSREFTIGQGGDIIVKYGLKENLSYLSDTLVPVPVDIGTYALDSVNFGHLPKTAGLTQRSISAWVFPRTVTGRILQTIADSPVSGFSFALGGTNKLQFYEKQASNVGSWDTDDNSITDNEWHHVVVTRDRSADVTTDPIIYIDGAQVNITETSAPAGAILNEEGLNLRIGSNATDGLYKDVRMYDRILTQAEVTELATGNPYDDTALDGMVFQSNFVLSDYGEEADFTDGLLDGLNVFDNIYQAVGIPEILPFASRTWTLRTTPNNQYFAVAYGNGLFVAVGNSSGTTTHVMTSPDGRTWTTRTTTDVSLFAICWSEDLGLFVAVGNNAILTSPDGITWTSRTSPINRNWRGVVWSSGLGIFVGVANYNSGTTDTSYMTSTDGITWTSGTIVSGVNINFSDICYSEDLGVFVACGNSAFSVKDIYSSTNGTSWTAYGEDNKNRYGCAYSPELQLFVTVGTGTGVSDEIYTSPDGLIWTARTAPSAKTWTGIVWSSELGIFLATANTGTSNRSMYSTDGITWTHVATPADYGWNSICWSPIVKRFVAVQDDTSNTNRAMTF